MYQFLITLKLEILVHFYLKKFTNKSVFKNDVFVKISLTNLQISFLSFYMSVS